MGPVPFTAILAWADLHEFGREATKLLVAVFRQLDSDRAAREASKRKQNERTP